MYDVMVFMFGRVIYRIKKCTSQKTGLWWFFEWIFFRVCFSLLNNQAVSLSLPACLSIAILCLFLSLMREWWWHVLGDGDRVPNQASYEAVSPLLISCPHRCLASFVSLSTHQHIYNVESPDGGDLSSPSLWCLSLHVDTYSHTNVCFF